jgi:NRPS condensation-like uncharacterized protein
MKTKQKVPVQKLSISVPVDLKPLIRQRAESLDLTVSQYIRKLVNEETQIESLNAVITECEYNPINARAIRAG